ncbi:LuxR C-terminal-related transcriptional regulator [Methylomonas sp. SURF-1]|uniref:LuxR C-terminal-related transcriptional regulator n=1 Tax=Methylomonas aurea TaxID=2952224 RepID=A0ABT1UDH6_9GAMM|nr:LuxR C-terminal-related transcriptional regulator [Methylomonas sp. SURF-1]MCQ8180205.1 LuxR C-terminal-related transcriptional regulator [Methylomonas sp. SURF-1]
MKFDRVILVVDADISSYKGILRMAERLAAEVVHFSCRTALSHWTTENRLRFDSAKLALCVVFDPEFLDVFERWPADGFFGQCPRVCISRAGRMSKAVQAINSGVFDLIEKPFRLDRMQIALEQALTAYECDTRRVSEFKSLTRRELQTCEMVVSGLTNREISEQLDISIKTVKVHRANLMRKVRAKSVTELLRGYDEFRASVNAAPGAAKKFSAGT